MISYFFCTHVAATTEIYTDCHTLSLHAPLPIYRCQPKPALLHVPRLRRAAHAAAGYEGRLCEAAADQGSQDARLWRDDRAARPPHRRRDDRTEAREIGRASWRERVCQYV